MPTSAIHKRRRKLLRPESSAYLRSLRSRVAVLCAVVGLAMGAAACRPSEPAVSIRTDDGSVRVTVELALTQAQQRRGLMFRDQLAQDAGMLFVFRHAKERSFWMKNTPIALDIIYIDGRGEIVSIAENTTPYSEKPIPSRLPAKYVLEVVGGFCRARGVRPGQTVELPADIDERAAQAVAADS